MAKIIKYKFVAGEVNHGTEEAPNIEKTVLPKELECKTPSDYDANYPIAEAEAIPDTIEVSGKFDPEPEPTPSGDDSAVWDELDAAYQEGVDSV